jgi:hypothetical protein
MAHRKTAISRATTVWQQLRATERTASVGQKPSEVFGRVALRSAPPGSGFRMSSNVLIYFGSVGQRTIEQSSHLYIARRATHNQL